MQPAGQVRFWGRVVRFSLHTKQLLSVGLYVLLPLPAGYLTRRSPVASGGVAVVEIFESQVQPVSISGF